MAKISDYINTRTGFANLDLFDVSATDDAGSTYESQKTTWDNMKTQLNSELSFLSSGDNISLLTNDSGYITSNLTHTGEVTGAATLSLHPTAISNKTLVTAVATDMVLLWDATDSQLKRADVADFLGGAADGNGIFDATNDGGTVPTTFDVALTDTLNFNTNLLYVDGTNTRVGINKVPTETLDVSGNTRVDGRIGVNTGSPNIEKYIDVLISTGGSTTEGGVRIKNSNTPTVAMQMTTDGSTSTTNNYVLNTWSAVGGNSYSMMLNADIENAKDVAPTTLNDAVIILDGAEKSTITTSSRGRLEQARLLKVSTGGAMRMEISATGETRHISNTTSPVVANFDNPEPTNAFEIYTGSANSFLLSNFVGVSDGHLDNSPTFKFRGRYDADATAGVNSTAFDATIQQVMTAGGASPTAELTFQNNSNTGLVITETGGIRLPNAGTPSNGHVLTSDASGNATWQAAAGGGNTIYSADDTIAANRTLSSGGDANHMTLNVAGGNTGFGVAVASIAAKLHVNGDVQIDNAIRVSHAGNLSYITGNATTCFRFGHNSATDSLGVYTVQVGNNGGNGGFMAGDSGAAQMAMWSVGSTSTNIGSLSNHDLNIYANNGIRMRIKPNGDVGFGIASASIAANIHTFGNIRTDGSYEVDGTQVLTNQQTAVADASGGATIDTEARTAINALLARCRTHGIIAT